MKSLAVKKDSDPRISLPFTVAGRFENLDFILFFIIICEYFVNKKEPEFSDNIIN